MRRRSYAQPMVRLLRLGVLLVLTFVVCSFTIAVATPETGPAEKVVIVLAVVGLLFTARPVRRLGSGSG